MRTRISTLIVALLISPMTFSQIHLFLEERQVELEDGNCTGWVFPVVQDLEEALKDLDDFCKDRSDVRMKKEGDNMIMAEKVSLPAIATKRGDLIGYGFTSGTDHVLGLVFRLGYDISLNSEDWGSEMENFHTYARQFMSYHYELAYDRRMDEIDDQIEDVEKEKDRTEKDIDQLNRKIENNNKRIEKETDEGKLIVYRTEIDNYNAEIEQLNNNIPPLQSELEQLQERKDQLNTEAHTYLGTIGSL
jgi:prefoldin subunit 5